MRPGDDDLTSLRSWLTGHGGFLHPALRRRTVEGLTGIFTGALLPASETIVEIPASLIIGPRAYAELAEAPELDHERDQTLYAFLIEVDRGERSRFHPWISRLPKLSDFQSYHPIFAGDEDLQRLHQLNPRIAQTLMGFRSRIEDFHRQTGERFEFSKVLWASLIYLTRAFDGYGLVPVCDLFNHHAVRGRGLIDGHRLGTAEHVDAGSEVYISYGRHFDSLELWLHFGFIDPNSGPVIGCSGIRAPGMRASFDQDCFIDERGPSARLLEVCRELATPVRPSEAVLTGIKKSISAEIHLGEMPDSPLVRQAHKICAARIDLVS
jgi:hypothetical protein